ncbi:unnamed protein product, partial [Natator depressus]
VNTPRSLLRHISPCFETELSGVTLTSDLGKFRAPSPGQRIRYQGVPATFQRLVDQLLRGMESFAVAYIDDICVFSQTWEDHVSQVRQVLDQLQGAWLTVKAEKCKVGMAEVSYLGHQVGSSCLKPEPAKVEVIQDWPAPHTKKQ